ncbi:hypothetical protein CIHG_04923 [Coccidioides immitis H538.4]|uniref:Uncharacterized protein n=1 Tax=Coccidioides immitis H538.4 TaxID=396776 RepID=A0A0J8UHS5_COCIT|nr:hypothetical protein CIHG_04923 [Coccidioides immitis H538.4]
MRFEVKVRLSASWRSGPVAVWGMAPPSHTQTYCNAQPALQYTTTNPASAAATTPRSTLLCLSRSHSHSDSSPPQQQFINTLAGQVEIRTSWELLIRGHTSAVVADLDFLQQLINFKSTFPRTNPAFGQQKARYHRAQNSLEARQKGSRMGTMRTKTETRRAQPSREPESKHRLTPQRTRA